MARGYEWGIYSTDEGALWALQVDADYFLQSQRGWGAPAEAGMVPLPRGWRPRVVVGIEESGRQHTAIVSRTDADLWTGVRADFDIVDTDGQVRTCLVYRRLGERTTARPT